MNGGDAVLLSVVVSVVLIATGAIDLDWQLVSYRYSEWHRTIDYWEYNPFLKINWWLAYALNVLRVAGGCLLLGFMLSELRYRLVKKRG